MRMQAAALIVAGFLIGTSGGTSADQAIDAWREDDRYLGELRATLESGCHLSGQDRVECPGRGSADFRAGLVKSQAGWRLEYLVEGD